MPSVFRSYRVDELFVDGPDLVPLHVNGALAEALRQDELAQTLHGHTAAQYTLHGRESRVIPSLHVTLVHEPGELSLRQHGLDEVQAGELHQVHLAQSHGLLQPLELLVAVLVLRGSHGVRDSFDRVDDGAGKVVGRVCVVLGAGAVVRQCVGAIQHWITAALVGVGHVHVGSEHPLGALGPTAEHQLEVLEVVLYGVVPEQDRKHA